MVAQAQIEEKMIRKSKEEEETRRQVEAEKKAQREEADRIARALGATHVDPYYGRRKDPIL